jgi:hypothetical protein
LEQCAFNFRKAIQLHPKEKVLQMMNNWNPVSTLDQLKASQKKKEKEAPKPNSIQALPKFKKLPPKKTFKEGKKHQTNKQEWNPNHPKSIRQQERIQLFERMLKAAEVLSEGMDLMITPEKGSSQNPM